MADTVGAGPGPMSLQFQGMDDWVKEQDALEAKKVDAKEAAKKENVKPTIPPPAKKAKHMPDLEALAIEKEATEEMGDENWIGKLQRKTSYHPRPRSWKQSS